MGSIYRRGSRYWIKYRDESGGLVRRSAEDTYAEAFRVLQSEADSVEGTPFALVFDAYLEHLRTHAKPRTVTHAERIGLRLSEHFGTRDVGSIGSPHVDRFIQSRKADGVKPRTINADLAYFRAILNHGVRVGMLGSVPVQVR